MAEETSPFLTDYLARHYVSLKRKLTRAVGSSDLAGDALQDTWIRLQAKGEDEPVQSPAGYLLRVALNIAVDIQRRQTRSLSFDELSELHMIADPAPGPAQTVEARSDMAVLLERVSRMPPRRRDIFVRVHWEGMAHKDVAKQLGISTRTVTYELKSAHEALSAVLNHEKK
ncbi:sigma-70 family RNA polymerase sigma factor [Bordetella petrii]|nr:sigma-70 family RNA polymerase sigma factor [Bordetella petrii]